MAVANQKNNLLEALKNEVEVVDVSRAEQIFLTPYLALACGLLYMMASDGELEPEESSQLQAVLGGDKAVLGYALRYVQSVPVEQFFTLSNELLSVKDKWCILTNVCDALLSDGHADPSELALFSQMAQAFGVVETQFEPYFKILALKNDKSVLGAYAGVRDERQPMTPHFALAIALLYMLTADGSIDEQEVGQLEAVIGEFEGLQNVALKYVRTVKLKQFLDEATVLLRPEQKIYILTNVCDSMLSDGDVALLEDKLFMNMLNAFGFTEKTFARYFQVLETKNIKPFDTSDFKNHVAYDRMISGGNAEGVVFKHARSDMNVGGDKNDVLDGTGDGVWVGASDNTTMSQFIARTMQENIQSVSDDFENQGNVVKVGLNATDGLNVQKIEGDEVAKNRQLIDGDAATVNLQTLDAQTSDANKQKIESDLLDSNRQLLDLNEALANRQAIVQAPSEVHRETLSPDVRAQNIHEVVEVVNHRLDRFEREHQGFLQTGRGQKFTDDFVLIEDDASDVNRQRLIDSSARLGVVFDSEDASIKVEAVDLLEKSKFNAEQRVFLANEAAAESLQAESLVTRMHDKAEEKNPKRHGVAWRGYFGRAMWVNRRRGFSYVQLAVAMMAIVFAAPISTQTISLRSSAGTLIALPVAAPSL